MVRKPVNSNDSFQNFLVQTGQLFVAADESAEADKEAVLLEGYSADDEKTISENKETFVFQAEVNRLMDIIINSLCKLSAHFSHHF